MAVKPSAQLGPAGMTSLSHHFAIPVPLRASMQAGPVSHFRYVAFAGWFRQLPLT